MPASLPASALRRTVQPRSLDLGRPTEQHGIVGHERAMEAVRFGVAIRRAGYHLFALGDPSVGMRSMIVRSLTVAAQQRPTPWDTVLLHDFDHPQQPRHVRVPTGTGPRLAAEVDAALERLFVAIPTAFEHPAYRAATAAMDEEFRAERQAVFASFSERARARGVAVHRRDDTLILAPLVDGHPADAETIGALPEADREAVHRAVREVQAEMSRLADEERSRTRELEAARARLDKRTVAATIRPEIERLSEAWSLPDLRAWFDQVERTLGTQPREAFEGARRVPPELRVNVLVTHAPDAGAPVLVVDDPTWPGLVGRVEHEPREGALVTHHGLVRPGALHRANGGFLIIDAHRLLSAAGAWAGLKRALRSRLLRLEPPVPAPGVLATTTLEPTPLELDVEVVLIGEPGLYRTLAGGDPEFDPLFGVAAEFDDDLPWDDDHEDALGSLLVRLARHDDLLPVDDDAVARLLEHAGRLGGGQDRLSLHVEPLRRILREAEHLASADGDPRIGREHVERALESRRYREGRLAERSRADLMDGSVIVATSGAAVGQVNGLAVLSTGRVRFGRPSRISARARMGRGHVVDIEREVGLGGPFHHKGVLILTGYLAGRYAPDVPLSLAASIVFEQSYVPVDGDSASMAELVALVSALSDVPLLQGRAITGSVNQHGEAQAIGGVNEKIEGWFELCRDRGLTGDQGVVIPAANTKNLMLREEVVQAVAGGRFHVWTMRTADDAIEILTGRPAGLRDTSGAFPPDSVNGRVEARLIALAERARDFQWGGR